MFVLLHEQKKSRHFIAKREDLVFSEKDNLKSGAHAIFNGTGERSSRCNCLVDLSGKTVNLNFRTQCTSILGTKEHCETSLSLINKIRIFAGESDSESDGSVDPELNNFDDNELELVSLNIRARTLTRRT